MAMQKRARTDGRDFEQDSERDFDLDINAQADGEDGRGDEFDLEEELAEELPVEGTYSDDEADAAEAAFEEWDSPVR
jgi:hypothetical protein